MIEVSKLTAADTGREVRYQDRSGRIQELGTIEAWNSNWVFVRYHTKRVHETVSGWREMPRHGSNSEATNPRDLEFC